MTTAEHAAACRQIARREEIPRLADCPYLRLTCVHGHSWHVTEDGAPLPAPEERGWIPAPLRSTGTRRCRFCGEPVSSPAGNRKFCPPPRDCYRLWARETGRKRESERVTA